MLVRELVGDMAVLKTTATQGFVLALKLLQHWAVMTISDGEAKELKGEGIVDSMVASSEFPGS